jgi:hypothetical protein
MTKQKNHCIKLLIFVTIFSTTSSTSINAQIKTPYQKKVEQLNRKFLSDIGVSKALIDLAIKSGDNMAETIMLFSEGRNAINSIVPTQDGKLLIFLYAKQFAEAEKLKTSVDFQRDQEKKEKEQREAKLKEIENQKKQAIFEKERLEKEKIKKYNNSDLVQIKSEVTNEFNAWLKKGEFEKTEDYESRMKNNCLENFEKINYDAVISRINEANLEFDLKEYNADKEYFSIELKYKDLKWIDVIKVSINKAPNFKDHFRINEGETVYQNWGIYENQLYPQKIIITDDQSENHYEFILPITKFEDYKVSTSVLGITNSNFNKLEFSFFDYQSKKDKELELANLQKKQKEEEQIRLAALKQKQEEEFKELANLQKKQKEEEQIRLATLKQKQEEEFKELQARQYKFESTDLGKLQNFVKKEFKNWLVKSDFESNSDYSTRIKTQADTKFANILDETIKKALEHITKSHFFLSLSDYDADNESFQLIGGYTTQDTILIKISKQYAKDFYRTFHSKEIKNEHEIIMYPIKMEMVDNNWKVVSATIIFNNFWWGNTSSNGSAFEHVAENVYTNKGIIYYNNGGKPYKATDLKELKNTIVFPKDVYYLKYEYDNTITTQKLNFNYTDLGINIPNVN